jgi:hypothetical protein
MVDGIFPQGAETKTLIGITADSGAFHRARNIEAGQPFAQGVTVSRCAPPERKAKLRRARVFIPNIETRGAFVSRTPKIQLRQVDAARLSSPC